MKMTLHSGATVLAIAILCPSMARAAPDSLARARQAYEEFEYDSVLQLLEQALREDPTDKEKVEAYALMANMHVMHGRRRQAQRAFASILKLDPGYELPGESSPKMRAAFDAARASHIPLDSATAPVERESPGPVDRDATDSPEREADEEVNDAHPVTEDPSKRLVRQLVPEREPFYQSWWFWTAVGVVAVGAAGASWYALNSPIPDHDLGPIVVGGP